MAQPQNTLTYHSACANVEVSFDKHKYPRKINGKAYSTINPTWRRHWRTPGSGRARHSAELWHCLRSANTIEYPPSRSTFVIVGVDAWWFPHTWRMPRAHHSCSTLWSTPWPVAAAGRPNYISIEDAASALLCAAARASHQADCLV